jgi:hypothetical protein
VVVLFAFLLVTIFGFTAFAVDVGYMTLLKTQLQNVADAAAMGSCQQLGNGPAAVIASAKAIAAANKVDGVAATLQDSDIELGVYSLSAKTFTPGIDGANAVRITARAIDRPLFFAPVIGHNTTSVQTQAISMLNPRDIVFCIDLSGSMNDDSEPWAVTPINSKFAPSGYGTIANSLMQDLFTDFGFGSYPGTQQWVGSPLSVSANDYAYAQMTRDNGPLTSGTIASTYRISNSDSEATRKTKAYSWMIDKQIAVIMPNAKPTPSSSTNYSYWATYLDYIIKSKSVSGSSSSNGMPRNGSTSSVTVPNNQDSDRVTGMNNPNNSTFPSASSSLASALENQIGYLTYVQFMMDFGRDRSPNISNSTNGDPGIGIKTPLSVLSPDCPFHSEVTAGGTFNFPPREQPTHAMRRAVIAALKTIKDLNKNVSAATGDWVGIVTFDAIDSYHQPIIRHSLSGDFTAAMNVCTTLQAVGDIGSSTATENGIILAKNHLLPTGSGGAARTFSTKVLMLITDGVPNIYSSSNSAISNYISSHSNGDWYSTSDPEYNSVLMQTSMLNTSKGITFSVGMGLGCDYNFMDRIARMGKTADPSGLSTRSTGNPALYEDELSEIFRKIIQAPGSRIVR